MRRPAPVFLALVLRQSGMPFCPFRVKILILHSAIFPTLLPKHSFSIPTIQNPSLLIILSPLSPRTPPAPTCHPKQPSSSPSELSTLQSSLNHHIHPHCTRLFSSIHPTHVVSGLSFAVPCPSPRQVDLSSLSPTSPSFRSTGCTLLFSC